MSNQAGQIQALFPAQPEVKAMQQSLRQSAGALLALPFDMARDQYAQAVRAGLIERSLLASARFGRTLAALEALALGPLARQR